MAKGQQRSNKEKRKPKPTEIIQPYLERFLLGERKE